ncbi:hypothetical protein HED60_07645 [Planctomycetales bacterium ZRK34]|nr:hypothetical protein HED60_07645 [Planctomycetales bacterium ZRK34]
MRIEASHSVSSSTPIRPIESTEKVTRQPNQTKASEAGDSLSFEAVYQSQLPRVPMTEAHRKLDRIRSQLVGGKTEVPIHFADAPAASTGPANPFTAAYPRLIADPGSINANLTAAATERSA